MSPSRSLLFQYGGGNDDDNDDGEEEEEEGENSYHLLSIYLPRHYEDILDSCCI